MRIFRSTTLPRLLWVFYVVGAFDVDVVHGVTLRLASRRKEEADVLTFTHAKGNVRRCSSSSRDMVEILHGFS